MTRFVITSIVSSVILSISRPRITTTICFSTPEDPNRYFVYGPKNYINGELHDLTTTLVGSTSTIYYTLPTSIGSHVTIGETYPMPNKIRIGNNLYNSSTLESPDNHAINSNGTNGTFSLGVNSQAWIYWNGSSWKKYSSSDRLDKTDILDIPKENATNFINRIDGKTFVYNRRSDYMKDGKFNKIEYLKGTKKKTRRASGFIAQEVYNQMISIFKDDNYASIVDREDYNGYGEDRFFMRKIEILPFLVETIKYQQEIIKKNQEELDEIEKSSRRK